MFRSARQTRRSCEESHQPQLPASLRPDKTKVRVYACRISGVSAFSNRTTASSSEPRAGTGADKETEGSPVAMAMVVGVFGAVRRWKGINEYRTQMYTLRSTVTKNFISNVQVNAKATLQAATERPSTTKSRRSTHIR
jgi:hypothetical protein